MDDVLKVAVAGTTRVSGGLGSSGAPIDRAVAQLDVHGFERRLLLTAGTYAIRRRAGVLPLTYPEATDIAGDEVWDVAPERVRLLIDELLIGQATAVLPLALERLQRARLLLPPTILPAALDAGARSKAIRPELLAVIGERGRWLARRNKDWSWATTPGDDELAANADTIWQEGKQAERLAVLRLIRASDPARGRAMIESTWQRERVNFRAEAIDILSVNLSPSDQPILEAALEDRAQPVQERAEALLIRIPASRPARDAVERAEPLITKRLGFQIVIRPPDDADASSDSERAAAMTHAISRVPPSDWVAQLGKQPADLVKTIARDRDWGFAVLDGWTRATLTFGDADWAAALWSIWIAAPPQLGMTAKAKAGAFDETVNQYLIALLPMMRPSDAEQAVVNASSGSFDPIRLAAILPHLTRPWSADFTERYLRTFHRAADTTLKQAHFKRDSFTAWASSLQAVALAIPASNIQNAVVLLSQLSDTKPRQEVDYYWMYWQQTLKLNIETLQLRQRIIEEIPG